jgi:flagellar biosynthesis/type III secretory pathway protein FliH
MINFQTIAVFNYPFEIVVLKSILEYKEIPFLFLNENLIAINPMASIAYGGIQLKVHPNDFEIVQAILDNLNNKMEIV